MTETWSSWGRGWAGSGLKNFGYYALKVLTRCDGAVPTGSWMQAGVAAGAIQSAEERLRNLMNSHITTLSKQDINVHPIPGGLGLTVSEAIFQATLHVVSYTSS